jgi:hypothetical protein
VATAPSSEGLRIWGPRIRCTAPQTLGLECCSGGLLPDIKNNDCLLILHGLVFSKIRTTECHF